MDELTDIHQWIVQLPGGYKLALNSATIIMTLIVMGLLLVFSFFATRRMNIIPHSVQVVGELLVNGFYGLTKDTLDKEMAKKYFPLIFSLFLFVGFSNCLGLIPKLSEPTRDLNTPLGLGIMGFVIAHYSGIKTKGFFTYFKDTYCDPFWFMVPLNLVSEVARVVSISFRLYGNIMGGAIIIMVVSHLIYSIILPPLLNAFFGFFIGTIQAFVFTMLTVVYISVQVK